MECSRALVVCFAVDVLARTRSIHVRAVGGAYLRVGEVGRNEPRGCANQACGASKARIERCSRDELAARRARVRGGVQLPVPPATDVLLRGSGRSPRWVWSRAPTSHRRAARSSPSSGRAGRRPEIKRDSLQSSPRGTGSAPGSRWLPRLDVWQQEASPPRQRYRAELDSSAARMVGASNAVTVTQPHQPVRRRAHHRRFASLGPKRASWIVASPRDCRGLPESWGSGGRARMAACSATSGQGSAARRPGARRQGRRDADRSRAGRVVRAAITDVQAAFKLALGR